MRSCSLLLLLSTLVAFACAVCVPSESLCNPSEIWNSCSSNSDCKCLSSSSKWGVCALQYISCSSLDRCADNLTCAKSDTVCVTNHPRCGNQEPLCYPLILAAPSICPPFIPPPTTTPRPLTSTTTTRVTSTINPNVAQKCTTWDQTFDPVVSDIPLPLECSSHMEIDDETRNIAYSGKHKACDQSLFSSPPVWVRFTGASGSALVTGIPNINSCGTDAPGWFNGTYPVGVGSTTTGTVCYNWGSSSCSWSNQISVTSCNGYFVYKLTSPPACTLRYCTC